MRAFLSLDLENIEVKKEIKKIQYELGRIKAKIKLVETNNLHFTLKFFPYIISIVFIKCFKVICT